VELISVSDLTFAKDLVHRAERFLRGFHDMHGNVWEWCSDWFGPYPSGETVDPLGASTGKDRIMRGGSYQCEPVNCRSGSRCPWLPNVRKHNQGLRLARSR